MSTSKNLRSKKFLDYASEFHGGLKDYEVVLSYEGEITQLIMKTFTALAQGKMEKNADQPRVKKKVYHVMVESLQNIFKHSCHVLKGSGNTLKHGILLVLKTDNEYKITTGNLVEKKQTKKLASMLDHINSLNTEKLNMLYKKQIKDGEISEKSGAGLGFIDIKRKTGRNFSYEFFPVDSTYSFFIFVSVISRN